MVEQAPNTVFREPRSSIVPHVSLYVVQFIALAAPPFRRRRLIFGSLIIILAIQARLNPHFTNNVGLAQPFTISWSYYLATLAKLFFTDCPESSFWRIDKKEKEALTYPAFSVRKWRWATMVIFNQRGIRWNHQVKNIPTLSSPQTRRSFLARQAYRFVKYVLVTDILLEFGRRLFFTPANGETGQMNSKHLTLQHPNYAWSFLKVFVFAATPYFGLSMQYAQFAFLAVLFNLSKPEDWPPPFGILREVTTVRDLWGKFWHQNLRHMLTAYTHAFANFFHIPRGTNLSSYTKLYLAFLISGTFHAMSQLQMPCPINITDHERTFGFFLFFVAQAAFITFEDFVQWLVGKSGFCQHEGSRLRTWVGYVWVTMALWWSVPLVGNTFLRARMGVDSLLPISVVRPLVERYVPITS